MERAVSLHNKARWWRATDARRGCAVKPGRGPGAHTPPSGVEKKSLAITRDSKRGHSDPTPHFVWRARPWRPGPPVIQRRARSAPPTVVRLHNSIGRELQRKGPRAKNPTGERKQEACQHGTKIRDVHLWRCVVDPEDLLTSHRKRTGHALDLLPALDGHWCNTLPSSAYYS